MSIVTKTGDKGDTGMVGGGRTQKCAARMHACGTVDELNAALGVLRAHGTLAAAIDAGLARIQHELFTLGADLATPLGTTAPTKRITPAHIAGLEQWIASWETALPPLTQFILPGGGPEGAAIHLARTVCRRAERWVVALQAEEPINADALVYCNRLSDLLFVLARGVNRDQGRPEEPVQYA